MTKQSERVRRFESARRAEGLKEIRVWVPDRQVSVAMVRRLAAVMRADPDARIMISRVEES
jgi:hypothetical protein